MSDRDPRPGPYPREYVVPELKLDPFAQRLLSENQNLCCALGNLNTDIRLLTYEVRDLLAAVRELVNGLKVQQQSDPARGSSPVPE